MKLLYIHNIPIDYQSANVIQVLQMCSAFSDLGVEVTLSVPFNENSNNSEINRRYGALDFNIIFQDRYTSSARLEKYINFYKVKKHIDEVNPDVCMVRTPLLLKYLKSFHIPYIFEVHNNIFNYRFRIFDNYLKKVIKDASESEYCIKMLSISDNLKKYWISKGIAEDSIQVLHDGFNEKYYLPSRSIEEARNKLNIPHNRKIVTYTGSLYENRGIENIINLAGEIGEADFYIIGGPEENKIKYENIAKSKDTNNIKFVGHVGHTEIPDYLYASDVLLALWSDNVKTINYCSPLKIFEYMAAGRIIVAHEYPTIKEVLTNGEDAILVNPSSITDLKKSVKKAITMNYTNKMADNSRNRAFQKYSWKLRAKGILDLIHQYNDIGVI